MRVVVLPVLLVLSCVEGSSSESGDGDIGNVTGTASCETDPAGLTPQYSCDSTATTGQCVDYLEGFDTSAMDVTCSALQGTAALAEACNVPNALGRCCQLLNGQWFVTHYAKDNGSGLSPVELQGICESGGGTWY